VEVFRKGRWLSVYGELDSTSRQTLAEAGYDVLQHLTHQRLGATSDARPGVASSPECHVIVDVAGLSFIDAAGLAGLALSIVNPPPVLSRICDICRLGRLLGESDPDHPEREGPA
jgi:hypothetical protein